MAAKIRAHAIVEGRVQMVFFRYSTCEQAAKLGLTGWVMNTPEGNVELVAEGPKDAVEALIKWCHAGPPHASVTNVRVTEEPYSGSYNSFDTRYAGGDC
jgi:acylphosphatase